LSEKLKRKGDSLKSLSLKFFHGGLTDIGMKAVQETLEKLVLLQKVGLKFTGCLKITNIGLKFITKGLGTLTLLREICIYFGYCHRIRDVDVEEFGKVLKGFKYLEAVRVDFSRSEVTDAGLGFLREIGKDLKTFEANFRLCSGITDLGLENLALREFVSLETLGLSFWDGKQMTDAGLSILSEGLGKLVRLQNLRIEFPFCSKITDKGFIPLCKAFQKLVLLQDFELDFSFCSGLTRLGGTQLCEVLKVLGPSLKRIWWLFENCGLFSDVELKLFYEILKNDCRSLEKIQVKSNHVQGIILYGKRNIRYTICRLSRETVARLEERELAEGDGKKREEKKEQMKRSRFDGFKRLFGCFVKKRNRKEKDRGIAMNNQL